MQTRHATWGRDAAACDRVTVENHRRRPLSPFHLIAQQLSSHHSTRLSLLQALSSLELLTSITSPSPSFISLSVIRNPAKPNTKTTPKCVSQLTKFEPTKGSQMPLSRRSQIPKDLPLLGRDEVDRLTSPVSTAKLLEGNNPDQIYRRSPRSWAHKVDLHHGIERSEDRVVPADQLFRAPAGKQIHSRSL